MRKYLMIIGVSLIAMTASSQDLPTQSNYDESFALRLVRIAWENHPSNKAARNNVEAVEYDKKLAGAEWLNTITLSGNLNEFNIDPDQDANNRSQFYPRYNLGANISLGVFFTIPYSRGKAKAQLKISENLMEQQRLTHKAQVLRLYNNLIMKERVYNLQEQALGDAESNVSVVKDQFSNGEVSYEAYSQIRGNYKAALISFYEAEVEYKNAKVTLEEFVGTRLEDIQ